MSFLPAVRLLRSSSVPILQLRQLVHRQAAVQCTRALLTLSSPHGNGAPHTGRLLRAAPPCTHQVMSYAKKAKKEKKDKGGKGGKPKVTLTDGELNEVISYDKMCEQMDHILEHLRADFIEQLNIRTNSGVLNQLAVDTPDGQFPLIQLGQVAQKTPQLVVINMAVNPQYVNEVKKALTESGMNLNPQQDGTTLFVPLPKVTKEHRENLAKNAKTLCTKAKDKLRDVHNTFMRDLKKKKDAHSEDLIRNIQEHIDQKMRDYAAQTDELMEKKQKELLQEK